MTTSCQYFTTDKVSSETFYEEELQAIDWSDVDQYPLFKDCENFVEKAAQKECFEVALGQEMRASIATQNILTGNEIVDTLLLTMKISNEGVLSVQQLEIDSVLRTDFPQLETWLLKSIDSLQLIAPAYKRGIPVSTQFTLPVVIKTD